MQTLIPVSVVWYSSDCLTESAYEHGQYNQCTNWIIQCLAFTAFRYINKSLGLLTNCLNCCSRWVFGTQITNQLTSINRRGFFIFCGKTRLDNVYIGAKQKSQRNFIFIVIIQTNSFQLYFLRTIHRSKRPHIGYIASHYPGFHLLFTRNLPNW